MTYHFRADLRPRVGRFTATVAGAAAILVAGVLPAQAATSAGWHILKTFATDNLALSAVAAISGGSAWVGGETPAQQPVLYHLVSGKWQEVPLAGSPGTFVNSVSATSPTNVWASLANTPAVVHLTKHGWVPHRFVIGSDQVLLSGVVTTGPTNTWVLAYDFTTKLSYAYHNNGHVWTSQSLPAAATGNSNIGLVSASSAANIWALTYVGGKSASMRYNGTKWQVIKFPANLVPTSKTLYARQILAESPTNVWAALFVGSTKGVGPVLLLHWDGHAWSKVTGKPPAGALSGPIASDGAGGLWLGGYNASGAKEVLLHYSGGHWKSYSMPVATGSKALALQDLALVPGSRELLGTAVIAPTFGGDSGSAVLRYEP